MQHHINCQTQKISASPLTQHLSTLAKIRGNTRNGYIPGEVDAMEQNTLKNHNALFWINPFAWPRKHTHTHKKNNVSEISNTREKMTTITTTTRSKKTSCKIAHDAVSPVPSSHQMYRTRTNRNTNGTEQSEKPFENTNQIEFTEANNKPLPQDHLQLTSTRHNTNALNKLIRFVVSFGDHVHRRSTCRCHTERKTA